MTTGAFSTNQPSPQPQPRPASPASFRASKIVVDSLNRFQKRALLLVRNGGSRPCRASRNDGFWHAFRTNATEVRAQKPSSDASKMADSDTLSGSMQQKYEQKSRPQTRLRLCTLTPLPDQCNRGTVSKPVMTFESRKMAVCGIPSGPMHQGCELFLFLSAEL